jgi:hypothetical protein
VVCTQHDAAQDEPISGERAEHVLRLRQRLERVNQAMAQWEEYDAIQALPEGLRRSLPTPEIDYQSLKVLRGQLMEQLLESTKRADHPH